MFGLLSCLVSFIDFQGDSSFIHLLSRLVKCVVVRPGRDWLRDFKNTLSSCLLLQEEPKKVFFNYDLFLNLEGNPPVNHLRCEKLTFNNPTKEFRKKLIKAGGVRLPPTHWPPASFDRTNKRLNEWLRSVAGYYDEHGHSADAFNRSSRQKPRKEEERVFVSPSKLSL